MCPENCIFYYFLTPLVESLVHQVCVHSVPEDEASIVLTEFDLIDAFYIMGLS